MKQLYWIRDPYLLLEIEPGDAWVKTTKEDYYDKIPSVATRAPQFKLIASTGPGEDGVAQSISTNLWPDQAKTLIQYLSRELDRQQERETSAEAELQGIMMPRDIAPLSSEKENESS
jgi:hypothetical protein